MAVVFPFLIFLCNMHQVELSWLSNSTIMFFKFSSLINTSHPHCPWLLFNPYTHQSRHMLSPLSNIFPSSFWTTCLCWSHSPPNLCLLANTDIFKCCCCHSCSCPVSYIIPVTCMGWISQTFLFLVISSCSFILCCVITALWPCVSII